MNARPKNPQPPRRQPTPADPVTADLQRIARTSLALTREHDPAIRIDLASQLADDCRWLLADVVNDAQRQGLTWQQIANALGISRQSAHERFAHVLQDRPLPM